MHIPAFSLPRLNTHQQERAVISERRWVLWFSLGVMLVTSLPYLLGYAMQGSGWQFTGFVFGVEDGNSYIAKMLSGSAGAWLFRTPYTAQPQRGVLAFLPYLLLGKLAAPPGRHEQLVALYHLYRLAAGVLAILATYDFLAVFIRARAVRRWALVLAVLGGGLGWVLVLVGAAHWLGSLPLDFYSPESFGFLMLFGLPHLALARAMLLWGLAAYLKTGSVSWIPRRFYRSRRGFNTVGIVIGGLWIVMGLAQPMTVVVAWFVLFAHLVGFGGHAWWRHRRGDRDTLIKWLVHFRRAFWAVLVSAPIVVYTLLAFNSDPFLKTWTSQNLILSPHPLHYLVAYGFLLPFAILGARRLMADRPRFAWMPVAWALCLPLLAYAPYNLQRRLPEGIWVAFVVLAMGVFDQSETNTINQGDEQSALKISFGSFRPVSCLLLPSTLILLVGGLSAAVKPSTPVFRERQEVEAFEFLETQIQNGDTVLASYETGNALPAWVPARVVVGHGPESADLRTLLPKVQAFFRADTTDDERLELLNAQRVRFVFWGPAERALGAWNPAQAGYLAPAFRSGEYEIYANVRYPQRDATFLPRD
ncbi:MAG: hypothetical protein P8074_00385 [Anaerolineales bacterium]